MGLLKNLSKSGPGIVFNIPQAWIKYWAEQGKSFSKVDVEVGDSLVITPVFDEGIKGRGDESE